MLKIILVLFLFSFIPVFAQEPSFDDKLVSSEEYTKLVTTDYILEQKITELQKTNSELNSEIQNLTSQITELKNHGIKFGIDEKKLGKSISEGESQWKQGDLIIASATIIAFFGFGAFLTMRFSTPDKHLLYPILKELLYSIFGIQIIHLGYIGYIVLGFFHPISIIFVIFLTLLFLYSALGSMKSIFYLEYRLPEKQRKVKELEAAFMKLIQQIKSEKQTKLNDK